MAKSVNAASLDIFDAIAAKRQVTAAAVAAGRDIWDLANATDEGDFEDFQNTVCISAVTAADTLIKQGLPGSAFKPALDKLKTYYRVDLGLSGSNHFQSYLDSIKQRIGYEAAEALVSAYGSAMRLDPKWVFPKGTLVAAAQDQANAGMHEFIEIQGEAGASTVVAHDGALSSKVKGAVVMIVNQTAATSIATELTLTFTRQDGTTVDLVVTLSAATQWAKTYVGQQAIGAAGAAAAQAVIPVAATAQFKAGEQVLIRKADGSAQEVGVIKTGGVVANTSIELDANLVNTYAENDLVFPMFTNVAWKSGRMTQDKDIKMYALPDRVIAI